MKIESQKELIEFIKQEDNIDNIIAVFEKCINSKVVSTWGDESLEDFKNRLIEFIDVYGHLDISERPIIVSLWDNKIHKK